MQHELKLAKRIKEGEDKMGKQTFLDALSRDW
jgi:hypothetical protein